MYRILLSMIVVISLVFFPFSILFNLLLHALRCMYACMQAIGMNSPIKQILVASLFSINSDSPANEKVISLQLLLHWTI